MPKPAGLLTYTPSPEETAQLADPANQLLAKFPDNEYIRRLLALARHLGIRLSPSGVSEQWLYHPDYRTIYVWEPDLDTQPLSYLVVILAHELGHALDFDAHPNLRRITQHLQWWEVPAEIEESAFVQGFLILKTLGIPVSLQAYALMIEPPMGDQVARRIEQEHLCCLLSGPQRDWPVPPAFQAAG